MPEFDTKESVRRSLDRSALGDRESARPAPAAPPRRVTLGRLAPAQLLERLSRPGPEPAILAEIICAMYWGGRVEFDLRQVELLSPENWALAVEIMAYRRSELWSEPQFHVVAQWCRERHGLSAWDGEE